MQTKHVSSFDYFIHENTLKAASIQEIKTAIAGLDAGKLREVCLRLAKHKKENKELLSYLLFDADDIDEYINQVKAEIDLIFQDVNHSNLYFAKKTLRKILRITNKHIRFTASKAVEAELLLYFCLQLKQSGLAFQESQVLKNMYEQQTKKIHLAIESLHPDLQFDFQKSLELLIE